MFEVPQRQPASGGTPLTLFAPAPSTISFVPLTRNLSPADPFPYSFEDTRYRKRPPMVRNMRAVLKKASCGTRRIFRGIRCKKQASTVRKRYSVSKTAFSGTRRIFKGPQNSQLHRLWTAFCGTQRIFKGSQNSTCHIERVSKGARNGLREEAGKHKKRVLIKVYQDFLELPAAPEL